jgi:hypothetical protein
MTHTRTDKMIAAAVWLAQHGAKIGWGAIGDGKAVKHKWKTDLTDDPGVIVPMLGTGRNSVIVPTGRLVIIDIDKYGWYERLVDEAGLPDTFWVRSPTVRRADTSEPLGDSGVEQVFQGRHLYVTAPDEYDILTIPGVWQGGETRRSEAGEQSMVLGPWSLRVDGVYEVLDDTPRVIAEAPASVFDFIRGHAARKSGALIVVGGGFDGEFIWDSAVHGSRHDHLRNRIRAWRGDQPDPSVLMTKVKEYIERHRIPLSRPGGKDIDDDEITEMIVGAMLKFGDDLPDDGLLRVVPSAGASPQASTFGENETETVIDPLAIESRVEHPTPLDFHSLPLPAGVALLLTHLDPLTDAPHTSLVLASMVAMSALVGPVPSLQWRGRHRAALFGCLVGESNYGRKGATMREVRNAFMQVDVLLDQIEVSGLASGEVLVDILNESKQNDLGTALIWEHEIANVLILAAREGSIMSGNLRRAWDGDTVQSRSRTKGKSSASGYNVAFMGGITPGELAKRLSADDIANGWANRFLWFYSEKRAGGYDPTHDGTLDRQTIDYLQQCIEFGRNLAGTLLIKPTYTMVLRPDAQAHLEALAVSLDVPPVGAIGALRQRMPAHIVRLAMVAALFDMERQVSLDHVLFAEALARYAVDSMRAVFGVRVDDPLAMLVLGVLVQAPGHWLNTSDLRRATGGKDHSRLMSALRVLLDGGLIVREDRVSVGVKGGRPSVGYRIGGV